MKHKLFYIVLFCVLAQSSIAQVVKWNTPGAGNPIIPGYFADPTVKKFGDTYYIYATTDGNGGGLGPAQVWVSKDFVNWTIMPMNWPTSHYIWAPDVMFKNGKYYFYYCQPCKVYCGVGDTPRGPWHNILGNNVLGEDSVLVPDRFVKNVITLDGQSFVDDDGKAYLCWGTWGIYKDFGAGIGQLADDFKHFVHKQILPNTQAKDFFEGPFLFKRNGIYYFTYSSGDCHDSTYCVQYATSTTGPFGSFTFGKNNPILSSDMSNHIDGPGHHSILKEGNDYYIIYHRHNIPNSTRGMHRQLAADRLLFDSDGSILPVKASHKGVGCLQPNANPYPNLAYCKPVIASSAYKGFPARYAVDDNNATLWRPAKLEDNWITIDLGKVNFIQRIYIQFEYATFYYQYITETSIDGKHWTVFADKRNNHLAGSPMVDYGRAKARYIKLAVTGCQKRGYSGSIWNIKVFSGSKQDPPQLLVGLSSKSVQSSSLTWRNDCGMLGGVMKANNQVSSVALEGKIAVHLLRGTKLVSSFLLPNTLKEGEYTLCYKIYNLETKQWVKTVINNGLSKSKPLVISADNKDIYISDIRFYNWPLSEPEIDYYSANALPYEMPAPRKSQGLILDINADQGIPASFHVYDTLQQKSSLPIVTIKGKRAFKFDGNHFMQSEITLPTLVDNAPYTLIADVLNPTIQTNECVADITDTNDELGKIMFCNGSEPRCGVVNHYGEYEDMGFPDLLKAGEWQHWVITYDGYIEKVYLNGRMVRSKNILLLLPESHKVTIGCNSAGIWFFTGYLHSLQVYDKVINAE